MMTPEAKAFSQFAVNLVRSLWIMLIVICGRFLYRHYRINLYISATAPPDVNYPRTELDDRSPIHALIFCSSSSGLIGFDM